MIAILVIAALVMLVWGTWFVLRGHLLLGCLGYLLVACFSAAIITEKVGGITVSVDRIAILPVFAAFLAQRLIGRTEDKPWCQADYLLLGLLSWLTLSMLIGGAFETVPGLESPVWRLAAGYGIPALIYLIARQSRITERGVSGVQLLVVAFGFYLAVTGVCEVTRQWWLVYPKEIANPNLGIHFGRARGPMLTAISYGTYVALALLCLSVYRDRYQRLPRLMLVILPAILAGIYVSYTRSVWIAGGVGLFIVMVLTSRGRLRVAVLVSPVAVGLLAPATLLDNVLRFQRDQYSAQETQESAMMRAMFAHVSWNMFLDRPLMGVGFGHFAQEKLPYLHDRSTELPLQAIRPLVHHSTLLSLLTETGAIGFLLFAALLLSWMREAWSIYRSPHAPPWARRQAVLLMAALVGYLSQLAFHELSYSTLDNGLVFLLAGITVGLKPLAQTAPAESTVVNNASPLIEHPLPQGLVPA